MSTGVDSPKKRQWSRITLKSPEWSYLSLEILLEGTGTNSEAPTQLDLISFYTIIHAALRRALGLVGSSMHFDILHSDGLKVILRVPSKDFSPFCAAVSAFYNDSANKQGGFELVEGCSKVGIRLIKSSRFLTGIVAPSRQWTPPKS
ncbi:hypothetical protein V1512DRAFT_136156 [Lipomyces arxii]|uniref:uncharacterized protein n=1 Tax=Lipomyces arxii TaxID=56418 RepID=UPI0034CE2AEF